MNAHHKNWPKTGAEAKTLLAKEMHPITGKPSAAQVEAEQSLDLPLWRLTSTMLAAKHVSPTGAASLTKAWLPGGCYLPNAALPYVDGWKNILEEIEFHKHGFVRKFLQDVIFWHHQSTNGRFNVTLGRFERWGVKSVAGWLNHTHKASNPGYKPKKKGGNPSWEPGPKNIDIPSVSRATFFRIKNRLIGMGLIEAHSHLRTDPNHKIKAIHDAGQKAKGKPAKYANSPKGITALWIKPTDALSRIMFEPGYWETVRETYAYAPAKMKPRGLSAKGKIQPPPSKNETSLSPTGDA